MTQHDVGPPDGDPQLRLVTLVGGVIVVVLLIAGLLVATLQGGGDAGENSAGSGDNDSSDPATPTEPKDDDPGADAKGQLDVGLPFVNQPCKGQLIVVLASTGTPRDYVRTIRSAAAAVADAKYLRTDQSCKTFNQTVNGHPIYAAYIGPFDSMQAACVARAESGVASSYVRTMSVDRELRELCSCFDARASLPRLTLAKAAAAPLNLELRVYDLQTMLGLAGFNPAGVADGRYDARTRALVVQFQRAHRLRTNGVVDDDVWRALRRDGCP